MTPMMSFPACAAPGHLHPSDIGVWQFVKEIAINSAENRTPFKKKKKKKP